MKKILVVFFLSFSFLLLSSNNASAQTCIAHGGLCHPTIPCCSPDTCRSGYCETGTGPLPTVPPISPLCDDNLWCDCNSSGTTGTKLKTAIGCIPVLDTKEAFLSFVLKWAVGIGGGIAFLLIVYAGFMIMTSAGNPERLKAGQELLTSAISGLILLIFSVVILKIIGVDILQLGKFGFGK